MLPDATFEPAPPQRTLRLRFSLLALLIFVTLICVALAWLVQPNYVVATALFQVDSVPATILGEESNKSHNEQEFAIVKKTQVALLRSYFVLNSALRNPGIASLPIFHGQDPVEWLQERLEVDFPENSEILAIRLRGPQAYAEDLVQIVDAVAKAYRNEVIYEGKQRRLATRDLLARSLENLKRGIERKFEQYLDIAREADRLESGSGQVLQEIDMRRLDRIETELMRLESLQHERNIDSEPGSQSGLEERIAELRERLDDLEKRITARSEKSVELTTRQRELDQLQRIADEMSLKLEKLDIEASAPERIRQIQQAVVNRE